MILSSGFFTVILAPVHLLLHCEQGERIGCPRLE
jgi:hypothetical protein